MRKNQALLVAGILLLASTVVAQAQNLLYEIKLFTTPAAAAPGGRRR